jgi:raffinose/stachyose/melibiose transport system permease protein
MKWINVSLKYVFLIIMAVIQIVPLVWLLLFSLKDNNQIFGPNSFALPSPIIWGNYTFAFTRGGVGRYFFNSVIVSFVTVILVLILSSMVTYAIIRMQWALQKAAYVYFLMGLMIPIHSGILPLFLVLRRLGLLNTRLALIMPYTAFGLSMAIMIISGFIIAIPRELEEAAAIDGASIYRIFYIIVVPLIKPALAAIIIITFKNAWNEMMMATVFINKAELKTLTVGINSLVGEYLTEWGVIGAGLMIASLPIIIVYLIASDKIQEGLIAGAVKG